MRLSVRFLLLLLPVLAGVAIGFNVLMDRLEKKWARDDLYQRARVIYDSIQDPVFDSVTKGNLDGLLRIYKRLVEDPSLMGVMVCSKDGTVISKSGGAPRALKCDWQPPTDKVTPLQAKIDSGVVQVEGRMIHKAIFPLLSEGDTEPRGYVLFFHDPSYLVQRSELARSYTYYVFLVLGFFISLITLMVYRWSASKPVEQFTEVMKGVITGDVEKISKALENTEFAPLVKDVDQILYDFRRAKGDGADAESNLWSASKLNQEVERLFGESRMCVISNEEPYIHNRVGSRIEVKSPASGVVKAVEPLLKACSGVWIGDGAGTADHETADKNGMLLVPPGKPEYALKRVWLSRDEEEGFYFGFSNEGLWPLCHIAHERPQFRQKDWEQYVAVNAKYASIFNDEMKGTRPITLIQDYQFALMPSMIRKMRPDALVTLFWHIPWPSPESFRICPWRKDILMGMLGADLIGFQQQYHCNAFLDTVDRFLEARVSRDQFSVTIQGHTCYVKPFPTSVEWPSPHEQSLEEIRACRTNLIEELSLPEDAILGVGVDRLDYTKGIVERFQAIERLLEQHPELVGKVALIQLVSPSRMHIKRYQELSAEVQREAERINWRFYSAHYKPIVLRMQHHTNEQIVSYYRAADFLYVSSLHDGMSLVAKEFIASRNDEGGVLVLSSFTGAARELKDALIVNPYDIEESADAIYQAIQMSPNERKSRMQRLRNVVANNNVYGWGAHFLRELHAIAERQRETGLEEVQ